MSDESISYGEDKENLRYISKNINVAEFGLSEDSPYTDSVIQTPSEVSVKLQESETSILKNVTGASEIFQSLEVAKRFKSFNLTWSFGINSGVGLINLTNNSRKELFFSSVHSAIIYNYCTREMKHLEGHHAIINCISSDKNGDWLATSDGDPDGCLIIWSSKERCPIWTMFKLYPDNGIMLMAMSPSGRYLITIGDFYNYYHVDLWLWTLGVETANDTFVVGKHHGIPIKICYHPDVEEHIMIVFEKHVFLIIWNADLNKLQLCSSPSITHKNRVGQLTSGIYMEGCHESFVSSKKGCISVFRSTLYRRRYEDGELTNNNMYINSIKVSPASIECLATTDRILVVGDSRGYILFFDQQIKILYWLRNVSIGAITSISFSLSPKIYEIKNSKIVKTAKALDENDYLPGCEEYEDREEQISKLVNVPFDASLNNDPFIIRDFFVSAADSNIYSVDFINNLRIPLFQVADANITSIDTHDEMPRLVVGYENGRLSLINFEKKVQIAEYLLPNTEETLEGGDAISCIKFSHNSYHLVCGRCNGEVWILEPVILNPKMPVPFRSTRAKVEKIDFSHNSLQFAYFDKNQTVILFNYNAEENCWQFSGKIRSHHDTITDIRFFCTNDRNTPVLFTLGADRYLVEYNNIEMRGDKEKTFGFISKERIEQRAIPLNFTYYERTFGKRAVGYILISNNQHKIKTINLQSKAPRSIVLGPSFGCFKNSNIRKMMVLPDNSRYMVFISEKNIGVYLLPLDGNPYKYTGYLAHPKQIVDFALSYDSRYAFTYGKDETCILQWEIQSVDLLSFIGGTQLEPYYCLLEGGKNGWLFHEIQDLFFYMQILPQENIDLPRRVSDSISLTELPDLVRTCGYYLSQFELEIMMIDIRYRDFDEHGLIRKEISFVDFVKLFINHRPAYGYTLEQINERFSIVCHMAEYPKKSRIESPDFIYLLQNIGEPSENLSKYLRILLRIEGEFADDNYSFLPQEITRNFLFYELLGIDQDGMDKKYNSEEDPEMY
ncbi:hypothetical protein ABEB36_012433 [Hypothenemus hampei]|uniref:Cilia- and flagella-associated protein 251 n=1 Tax=Hypothenemus hampei TaxID=57062 RepID=A0ABD1ED78_HYPHA